jgi:hypothetical protein
MQEVGFEPTKHYASELKSDPFDHSGTLAERTRWVRTIDLWVMSPAR